ncbi:MAG: hypothetical protein ACMUJI_07035 [Erythrobacter sp.]|uniref:hypothetical protein n=1 Tax=Erythrobacter sp. TaxID=1042 RepID=UPI003A841EF9
MKKLVLALGAVSLALSPVAASAVEGSQLSRSAAPVEGESELTGGSSIIIALFAAAAVIAGIVVIAGDSNDDLPTSP